MLEKDKICQFRKNPDPTNHGAQFYYCRGIFDEEFHLLRNSLKEKGEISINGDEKCQDGQLRKDVMNKDAIYSKVELLIDSMRVEFDQKIGIGQRFHLDTLQTNEDKSECEDPFVFLHPNSLVLIVGRAPFKVVSGNMMMSRSNMSKNIRDEEDRKEALFPV